LVRPRGGGRGPALLDREPERPPRGTPIPLLAHWFYCLPLPRQSALGEDGHAQRGGFLPPIPLPRRMWAGSRLVFHAPVRIGARLERHSKVLGVTPRQGRSGALVFVRVGHRLVADDRLALEEEHDIVYRERPVPGEAVAGAVATLQGAQWRERVTPDPVMLFRYSAITLNGHRIHYDRPYATSAEGYPGLVVHGPLLGTLLVDALAARVGQARVAKYAFRAVHPVFDIAPFFVCGRVEDAAATLWIEDAEGRQCMEATAELHAAT
jgi:3-methylfumaryl-CoA hydratase